MLASPPSPLPPSPRDYLSANATTPKAAGFMHQQQSRYSPTMPSSTLPLTSSVGHAPRTSEHYRRQSKDGYSLMSAPRISPPLTGLPTASARTPSGGSGNSLANPRRSFSQGLSGSSTLPSRRLSTAVNVDGLGGSGVGSVGSLHGRSGSSGSLQRSTSSIYASQQQPLSTAGAGPRVSAVPSAYSDGNLNSSVGVGSGRRVVSTMMSGAGGGGGLPQSSRRSASESMGVNPRASANANSEYARVFVPPRSSIVAGGGGGSQYQQQDAYTYRPEVPLRQSSLGAGGMATASTGGGLNSRNSLASLRGSTGNGGSSSSLQGLSGGSSSASQLRRAASMNVAPGGGGPHGLGIGMGGGGGGGLGGTGSLGRANGLMSAASASARQSYQSPMQQQQQQQQMQMPQQRYQRTSMYAHRS
ncbi:MAG: hypothetical protein J3R72DRAFT_432896 [Linnemannia gamsii]|nr:MAG: hypothetical protein J3R72DRAFT_432896 [Linnemannia gamsii]